MQSFSERVNSARAGDAFADGVAALLTGQALPPLSFRLGDETQTEVLARTVHTGCTGSTTGRHAIAWEDPLTQVSCRFELRRFENCPAVEWVVHFTNRGDTPAPVLTDVASLDLNWACDGDTFVYRAPGSDETPRDFQYQCEPLQTIRRQQGCLAMHAGTQGRSSVDWLPFFNLHSGDDGLVVALGWSGQWYARIDRDEGSARIRAGMEGLHLALAPGESIRGPRVLLLHWRGTPADGQNALRRLLREHYLPRLDGAPVEAPLCYGAWGGSPTPMHLAQLERIKARQLPYDCYWIDAGWYGTSDKPCPSVFEGEWGKTGNWSVNRRYHPDTLKPIGERVHAAGMDFLLWVEPERALHGAPVTLKHSDWFLQRAPGQPRREGDSLLLDLGQGPAREWATELVSGLVQENGLDWYRQDFNIEPLPYWRAADEASDRQGLTEIRYIEGLYAFWDELRRRHPRLRIDNCASGGRRLDLELLARSIPLWRNDYNCFSNLDPESVQVHGLGLSHWLPQHAISPCNSVPGDTYRFRSVVAPGVVFSVEEFGCDAPDLEAYPWDWHRRMLEDVRRARPFWHGDLYPLTSCSTAPDAWLALQLHRPDLNAGVILAFRRAASPLTTAAFPLRGLSANVAYTFEDADTGDLVHVDACDLVAPGLTLSIAKPRSSRLLFYKRKER